MRTNVAERLASLLGHLLGNQLPLRVRGWDGSEAGPPGAPVLVVNDRRAIRRMLWQPNELGMGRAYVAGELDVEGDLYDALTRMQQALPEGFPSRSLTVADKRDILRLVLRLGAVGRPPKPPPEEVRLSGPKHSRSRDRAAVSHHYDVGNDFYRLVLGGSLVYSCAYWAGAGTPGYGLDDAQRDKVDLVCRKLGLQPGMRLLDVGCGWGTTLLHAAHRYGVLGVGITLSTEQAELARKRVAEAGLSDRIDIRLQDYRDVDDGPFDAISSIGMAEHVGESRFRDYATHLRQLLRGGGRLLNHQIARREGPEGSGPSFISAYVFPDGELLPVGRTVTLIEQAGFEVRDLESLREHYALTLRAWVDNIERNWDRAVELTSPARARVWRLFMAASALSFEAARISVNQVLAVRTSADGASGLPLARGEWLGVS